MDQAALGPKATVSLTMIVLLLLLILLVLLFGGAAILGVIGTTATVGAGAAWALLPYVALAFGGVFFAAWPVFLVLAWRNCRSRWDRLVVLFYTALWGAGVMVFLISYLRGVPIRWY